MSFVYVVCSRTTGRFYTGLTSNLAKRLAEHNADLSRSTKHRGPWDLVHQVSFLALSDAVRHERYLKTGHGRDEVRQILAKKQIQNPDG